MATDSRASHKPINLSCHDINATRRYLVGSGAQIFAFYAVSSLLNLLSLCSKEIEEHGHVCDYY